MPPLWHPPRPDPGRCRFPGFSTSNRLSSSTGLRNRSHPLSGEARTDDRRRYSSQRRWCVGWRTPEGQRQSGRRLTVDRQVVQGRRSRCHARVEVMALRLTECVGITASNADVLTSSQRFPVAIIKRFDHNERGGANPRHFRTDLHGARGRRAGQLCRRRHANAGFLQGS